MLVMPEHFAIIAKIQNKKLMSYYLYASVQFRKRIIDYILLWNDSLWEVKIGVNTVWPNVLNYGSLCTYLSLVENKCWYIY
jgi:hypothetical protein